MKPPTGSGKGGVADPSVPRFKCQECRRTLVVDGVESFVDRLPTHATSGVHASAVQGSIMGASRMDNSFVVISNQKRSLGPGFPPHSAGAAAQHTEHSQSTRAIEGSYIMLPPPAASIYKASSHEGSGVNFSSPYSEHNSGFLSGVTVLKRAFDIATSQTQVEQPLCLNCTRILSDKMDKEIEDVTADINVYKACLQRLEQESYNILSEIDFQKEKQKIEEEEELKAAVEEAEKKYAEVASEMKSLETEYIEFEQLKERYWQEFNSSQFQLTSQQEERDAVSAKIEVSQVHLDLLKRTNVLNDAFHISHDGEIGTINNFHLGCLPDVKVEWDEINAAWGQAALLLHTMAQFGRGQWFWRTQFDDAMKTFLTCLREFAEFAMSLDKENNVPPHKSLKLPYKIDGDKVRGHTVVRCGNTEENWTRALKYMLCDLKWVLHWFVNSTSFALSSTSKNEG
ncbi:hypothetical protein PR202_gb05186 [Eleusine coracana subsp. coracana]|uniref:Beclin-1-like protein n=1 Tax=Eleusine coracana subsp. coracana TaxID=191504 RepID=A0AAV5E637_ELECO|nr:hypothetical protein PR202_gb05186 [Eleusine coracana subsp. coracana]